MPEFRVRVMLDVWVCVEATGEAAARRIVERADDLEIDEIHAVGEILEVEEEVVDDDDEEEEEEGDDGDGEEDEEETHL